MIIENSVLTLDNCPDLLTVEEAAKFLRISTRSTYELLRGGMLKSFKINNRSYRISKSALAEYLDSIMA